MRKRFITNLWVLLLMSFFAETSVAQHSVAGIPWSFSVADKGIIDYGDVVNINAPDYEKARKEDAVPSNGPYRTGLMVTTNLNFRNFGKFSYLPDSRIIWSAEIRVGDALATDIYYSAFHLPEGVKLFLYNSNKRQLLGAFSKLNNSEELLFTTAMVQGATVHLEMNIDKGVSLNDISLEIDRICASYRGGMAEDLNNAYGKNDDPPSYARPTDISDACNINAVCPEGAPYVNLKQTAAHIDMGGFVCSGNLINNAKQDCKPLFLTASHCDDGNGTTDVHFAQWKFYFNWEYNTCAGTPTAPGNPTSLPKNNVLVGARFKTRSFLPPVLSYKGDFLLLQLKDELNDLGNDFNAYLGGWDRATVAPEGKFIDFSHPRGDVKKVTIFSKLNSNGSFGGGAAGSHWSAKFEKGGIEGGSSGSNIFSITTQRMMGPLTGGLLGFGPCDTLDDNRKVFSKISLAWEYLNGGENTPETRLKDHLDPDNTNVMFVETVKVAADGEPCVSGGGVGVNVKAKLDDFISLYPNPSSGLVTFKVNLLKDSKIDVVLFDALGRSCGSYTVDTMRNGEFKIDLSAYTNGMYMAKIKIGDEYANKKIILNK